MENIINETELAIFFPDENGYKKCELKFDPLEFNITKDKLKDGDDNHTANEYYIIYYEVIRTLPEGYRIVEENSSIFVKSLEAIEQERWNSLSDEEKAQELEVKRIENLKFELADIERDLKENWDYKQLKYLRGDYTEEQWEEIKAEIRQRTNRIEEIREEINKKDIDNNTESVIID